MKIAAQLIGEITAGMTAVEVVDVDTNTVLQSAEWFGNGATEASYIQGLQQVYEYMQAAGEELQIDSNAKVYDNTSYTRIVLSYYPDEDRWEMGELAGAQSAELPQALGFVDEADWVNPEGTCKLQEMLNLK